MKEYSYGIAPYKILNNKIYLFVNKASKESLFGFFKGKIEINETIIQCATREFFEESNIKINENYLEKYFYQTHKNKNVGIFLIDEYNINFKNLLTNNEIYLCDWVEINYLYKNIILNQQKIVNNMILYFKDSNKIKNKNLFK